LIEAEKFSVSPTNISYKLKIEVAFAPNKEKIVKECDATAV
jgi:hypothetical protein